MPADVLPPEPCIAALSAGLPGAATLVRLVSWAARRPPAGEKVPGALGMVAAGSFRPPLPARSPLPAARSPLRCSVSEEELGRWPAAPRFCSHAAPAR